MNNSTLTDREKLFCELYAVGDAPFVGNAARSYAEAFQSKSRLNRKEADKLLEREDIREYLDSLENRSYEEARYMKKYLTANLMSILDECATAQFTDRRGTKLSTAPLRSVAVNAAKALADLYPVKEAQVNKLSLEGAGEGGITFNVIMPETTKPESNNN